jgi:GT2 family glycosyltransferase
VPRFSIVTPVYETPEPLLRAAVDSVRRQTYGDWELCLVDDGSMRPHVRDLFTELSPDPRIQVRHLPAQGGIVAASNEGLEMATGDFVVLLDHDDELHPRALESVAEALDAHPDADYLYTDEDKIDEHGRHSGVFLKPDWSPDRFRLQMYTLHLSVFRRELVDAVGGFDPDFEGSQDFDLVFRVTERAREVVHLQEVLYHWRITATSVTSGEGAKPWAYEAGTRAIRAHLERTGFPASVRHEGNGLYRLAPALTDHPLVSVVIPSAGTLRRIHGMPVNLLEQCVHSVVEQSSYENLEIVIVADPSVDSGLRHRLRSFVGDRLRIVDYTRPFNFSEKINVGALVARGDYLVLLNDDITVITPDWIESLLMYASRDGIGVVGAKLRFGDGRLQHVGLVVPAGGPGHIYRGYPADFDGYVNCVRVPCNYLALTGACMMTSAADFDAVGGFSPDFPLNYNDVDYCLKLRQYGKRAVYNPEAELYHFESSSRHTAVSQDELDRLHGRWHDDLQPDPYFNRQFVWKTANFVTPVYLSDGRMIS